MLCLQVPQLIPQIAAKLCSAQSLPLLMSLIVVLAQLVLLDAKTVVDILAASQLAGVWQLCCFMMRSPLPVICIRKSVLTLSSTAGRFILLCLPGFLACAQL